MDSSVFIDIVIALLIGAVAGGAVVFLLLKDRLQAQDSGERVRGIELLEQVAEHVGKVSYVFGKYASLVTEIGPRAERMSARQERELDDLSEALVSIYEEASVAESKLLLLGEQRLEKALRLYTAKMAQFRKQVYPGRYQQAEESTRLKKEVNDMRDQFYSILSERYDQKRA